MPGRQRASNDLAKDPGSRAKWGQVLRSTASISWGMRMVDDNWAKAVTPMVWTRAGAALCAEKAASGCESGNGGVRCMAAMPQHGPHCSI